MHNLQGINNLNANLYCCLQTQSTILHLIDLPQTISKLIHHNIKLFLVHLQIHLLHKPFLFFLHAIFKQKIGGLFGIYDLNSLADLVLKISFYCVAILGRKVLIVAKILPYFVESAAMGQDQGEELFLFFAFEFLRVGFHEFDFTFVLVLVELDFADQLTRGVLFVYQIEYLAETSLTHFFF